MAQRHLIQKEAEADLLAYSCLPLLDVPDSVNIKRA
jgi:hypothetical protein